MADDNLPARQTVVDDLSAFIDSSHRQLEELLTQLKWTKEELVIHTENEKKLKTCPINSHHRLPESSLEKHTHQCELVARGYSRSEQKEIQDSHRFFYANSSSVVPVLIDEESQRDILSRAPGLSGSSCEKEVPLTVDRMDKAFTSAEKLAIHQAVLERSKVASNQAAVSLQELEYDPDALLKKGETSKPKSRLEVLAELRDYKRRRQSYRAKNVHITRRSQTEIMREIIEAQMSEIQQAIQGKDGLSEGSDHRGHSPSPSRSSPHAAGRSPPRFRPQRDDYRNEHRSESRDHGGPSKRSRYEVEHPARRDNNPRSRDTSPSLGPSHYRSRDRYSRDVGDRDESPRIKTEADEQSRSREASGSPVPPRKTADGEPLYGPSSGGGEAVRIKVEQGGDSGSRSSSQSRGEDREHSGGGRQRHSKHKRHHHHHHHQKHRRHHSRDSK